MPETTDTAPRRTPMELLALVRLLALPKGKDRLRGSKLRDDVVALVASKGDPEAAAALANAVDALVARGDAERLPRGSLRATEVGRRAALGFLGLDAPPRRCEWRTLKGSYLVPRLLARAAGDDALAAATRDPKSGLKAAILRLAYGAPGLPASASLARVRNAVIWRALGIDSDRAVTANALLEELFLQPMAPGPRVREARMVPDRLIACVIGAPTARPDDLRKHLVRRWAAGAPLVGTVVDRRPEAVAPSASAAGPPTLEEIAARVREAAARVPASARFGPDKVFISHVWDALRPELEPRGLSESGFKHLLAEANHRRLLDLSRADLVEVMDPATVGASETPYLNTTFHFVRL